ncbi:MAG TPA: type II toxin-antitoxin system HicA family toxin [Candidatus Kapabacteria bacterium]|nr:type II toxin-antitoxin system HicA family toxin [Candidatus Kapabacteria bacterium]
MSSFPAVGGKDLIRALKALGFEMTRSRGSHFWLEHSDGRSTVIPVHSNETIGVGLLSRILRECEVTREELSRHL